MFPYYFIKYLCKKLDFSQIKSDTTKKILKKTLETTGVDYIANISYGDQLNNVMKAVLECFSCTVFNDQVILSLTQSTYVTQFSMQLAAMLKREISCAGKIEKGHQMSVIIPMDVFAHFFYMHNIQNFKMKKIIYDHYQVRHFIDAANNAGQLSKCKRAQMGCVLVKDGDIKYSGRNGHPIGTRLDCVCERQGVVSGTTFERGLCMHAEWNMIAKASKNDLEDGIAYINAPPCVVCARMLIQAGLRMVIFKNNGYSLDGVKLAWRLGGKTKFFGVK